MKELVPNKKSLLMPFAPSVQESLDKIDLDKDKLHMADGCIFVDGKFACISKGSVVEILNVKTGLRTSASDFTTSNEKLIVTCLIPCKSKLIIGLRCGENPRNGVICIYDPGISRVTKTVRLPAVPISIAVIREFGGASYETSLFSNSLKCFFGMIAVGTEDGHLYLIDMRADDDGEDCSFIPLNTLLLIDSSNGGDSAKMRDKARLYGQYCCVDLTNDQISSTYFKYVGINGSTLKMFSKENCGITSLLYLKQSVSLVVGYSFGSFQVWSLKDLQIKYSSALLPGSSPVSHFAFQEPENDPRHCCFLWVGRGPLPSQTQCYTPTSIMLYQMMYGVKEDIDGYGILYKQLDMVARRFEHPLTADAHHLVDSTSVGSRIISFNTLDLCDSTVCMMAWETPVNDANISISCHLGIFDLNCYYEKQLPRSIRDAMYGKMESVCPFFAFYMLTDIAEDFLPGGMLDVHLDAKSMQWFRTNVAPQSEQFSWPSAASFKLRCLSEIGTIEVEMLGMQNQIIADMIKTGTDSFLDIDNLIQSCCVAGLLQTSIGARHHDEDKFQTDALLSIALEHNGMIFITSCIKKWSHGSITHAGHSLKLLYDWAWGQVVQRKRTLDDLHLTLFNSLVENLEVEQLKLLKTVSSQLKDLSEILKELQHSNAITLDEGTQELLTRSQVTSHISMYTDILLLLVDCTLLPEKSDHIESNRTEKILYDSKLLSDYYEDNRKSGEENDLFIDLLWNAMEFPEDMKGENESDVLYPPQSVETICRLLIHNMSSDKEKTSCPFYYWFLDVCECYMELRSKSVVTKFKQLVGLRSSDEILVKSAWLLDHKLYNEASQYLLMIDVKISSLYYHHIVKILFKHQQTDLLALFLANKQPNTSCSLQQVKYLIYVMLQIGKLSIAYNLQSSILCTSQKQNVFNYYVEQCIKNKQLQRLMMLPLTAEEDSMLHDYLVMSKGNEDYLLVYYLEKGLFSKASEVTRKLKSVSAFNLDQVNQEHLQTQCLLVDGFSQIVPDIQQKKNENWEKLTKDLSSSPACNTPLSSLLIKGSPNITSSLILFNSLFKSSVYDKNGISSSYLKNNLTRRRKSPLYDSEPVLPKKQKEMETDDTNNQITSQSFCERISVFGVGNPYHLLSTPVSTKRNFSKISSLGLKQPQSILKLKNEEASIINSPSALSSNKRIRFIDTRSSNDSSSSLDGSFLENQSKKDVCDVSLISESSFASMKEEFSDKGNIQMELSKAIEKAESDAVIPTTTKNLLETPGSILTTPPHYEHILQETSMDALKPKRLSLSEKASEIISEIIKTKEQLSVLPVDKDNSSDETKPVEGKSVDIFSDGICTVLAQSSSKILSDDCHIVENKIEVELDCNKENRDITMVDSGELENPDGSTTDLLNSDDIFITEESEPTNTSVQIPDGISADVNENILDHSHSIEDSPRSCSDGPQQDENDIDLYTDLNTDIGILHEKSEVSSDVLCTPTLHHNVKLNKVFSSEDDHIEEEFLTPNQCSISLTEASIASVDNAELISDVICEKPEPKNIVNDSEVIHPIDLEDSFAGESGDEEDEDMSVGSSVGSSSDEESPSDSEGDESHTDVSVVALSSSDEEDTGEEIIHQVNVINKDIVENRNDPSLCDNDVVSTALDKDLFVESSSLQYKESEIKSVSRIYPPDSGIDLEDATCQDAMEESPCPSETVVDVSINEDEDIEHRESEPVINTVFPNENMEPVAVLDHQETKESNFDDKTICEVNKESSFKSLGSNVNMVSDRLEDLEKESTQSSEIDVENSLTPMDKDIQVNKNLENDFVIPCTSHLAAEHLSTEDQPKEMIVGSATAELLQPMSDHETSVEMKQVDLEVDPSLEGNEMNVVGKVDILKNDPITDNIQLTENHNTVLKQENELGDNDCSKIVYCIDDSDESDDGGNDINANREEGEDDEDDEEYDEDEDDEDDEDEDEDEDEDDDDNDNDEEDEDDDDVDKEDETGDDEWNERGEVTCEKEKTECVYDSDKAADGDYDSGVQINIDDESYENEGVDMVPGTDYTEPANITDAQGDEDNIKEVENNVVQINIDDESYETEGVDMVPGTHYAEPANITDAQGDEDNIKEVENNLAIYNDDKYLSDTDVARDITSDVVNQSYYKITYDDENPLIANVNDDEVSSSDIIGMNEVLSMKDISESNEKNADEDGEVIKCEDVAPKEDCIEVDDDICISKVESGIEMKKEVHEGISMSVINDVEMNLSLNEDNPSIENTLRLEERPKDILDEIGYSNITEEKKIGSTQERTFPMDDFDDIPSIEYDESLSSVRESAIESEQGTDRRVSLEMLENITDQPELVEKMEQMEVKKELSQGEMEWHLDEEVMEQIPISESGKHDASFHDNLVQGVKSSGDSSSEDNGSVITPVRNLRHRTVYKKEHLTPRTNKFRIKPSNEDLRDTSSTNVSDKDRHVSDSDAQVYHKRYHTANAIQKMKIMESSGSTSKGGKKKSEHVRPTRQLLRRTRASHQSVEKEDSSTSDIENEDEDDTEDESSSRKTDDRHANVHLSVEKKKQVEEIPKYFKMDEDEESNSDDIEINSADLEVYLGLTRKRAGRTRKSLKEDASPTLEELHPSQQIPTYDSSNVATAKRGPGRPKKNLQHEKEEDTIEFVLTEGAAKEAFLSTISDNRTTLAKDALPPQKKVCLSNEGDVENNSNIEVSDENETNTEEIGDKTDNSSEDTSSDEDDEPTPVRITRSQNIVPAQRTRSHDKLVSAKKVPSRRRISSKSPVQNSKSKPSPKLPTKPSLMKRSSISPIEPTSSNSPVKSSTLNIQENLSSSKSPLASPVNKPSENTHDLLRTPKGIQLKHAEIILERKLIGFVGQKSGSEESHVMESESESDDEAANTILPRVTRSQRNVSLASHSSEIALTKTNKPPKMLKSSSSSMEPKKRGRKKRGLSMERELTQNMDTSSYEDESKTVNRENTRYTRHNKQLSYSTRSTRSIRSKHSSTHLHDELSETLSETLSDQTEGVMPDELSHEKSQQKSSESLGPFQADSSSRAKAKPSSKMETESYEDMSEATVNEEIEKRTTKTLQNAHRVKRGTRSKRSSTRISPKEERLLNDTQSNESLSDSTSENQKFLTNIHEEDREFAENKRNTRRSKQLTQSTQATRSSRYKRSDTQISSFETSEHKESEKDLVLKGQRYTENTRREREQSNNEGLVSDSVSMIEINSSSKMNTSISSDKNITVVGGNERNLRRTKPLGNPTPVTRSNRKKRGNQLQHLESGAELINSSHTSDVSSYVVPKEDLSGEKELEKTKQSTSGLSGDSSSTMYSIPEKDDGSSDLDSIVNENHEHTSPMKGTRKRYPSRQRKDSSLSVEEASISHETPQSNKSSKRNTSTKRNLRTRTKK